MKTLAISDFKAHCLAVLDEVARTGEPVTILKRGKPLARVLPSVPVGERYPQQRLSGTVEILGDIVSPALSPDAWDRGHRRRAREGRAATD